MKRIYLTVAEPKERNDVAQTRFVSPREAVHDIETFKAHAKKLLEASEDMQTGIGFLPRELQLIVDNILAGAQYLFVTLGCAKKNHHLLRCHLVAPRFTAPIPEAVERAEEALEHQQRKESPVEIASR